MHFCSEVCYVAAKYAEVCYVAFECTEVYCVASEQNEVCCVVFQCTEIYSVARFNLIKYVKEIYAYFSVL